MGNYILTTPEEEKQILDAIGVSSKEELYSDIPKEALLQGDLDIPKGLSELEVNKMVSAMAAKNTIFGSVFRGAGAYNHYIPSIVKNVAGKEEFMTTYTPYQAEISQGVLQHIFEFQTMMCELTGMHAANASVYDGASACAEAAAMCKDRKKKSVVLSGTLNPRYIETVKTYCFGNEMEVIVVPAKNGLTDMEAVKAELKADTACLIMQQPNYFGGLEDMAAFADAAHEVKAKFVACVNPMTLAIMEKPIEYGADVAVGEAQPFGLAMSFGGPYLGFMTATEKMVRNLPGRIVGQTTDVEGKRAFVLTLSAREQHIRREKASSNICSNQALCGLTASVYLSAVGPQGLEQVAVQSMSKAHYLAEELAKAGFERVGDGEFFHEFVTKSPKDVKALDAALADKGILGGLPLEDNQILWCCTEMNSKADIDNLVAAVKEA